MMSPYSLAYLLLLPLVNCSPLRDRRGPTNALSSFAARVGWSIPAEGLRPHFMWGSSRWSRAPWPQALLVKAKELQTLGRVYAGFRLRFRRQDEGSEGTSFLPVDGEKASGLLGNLAEELNGYSRKKGGFSFRFGRR
ncbi:orexigenic neuropeptide QRFP [Otolemur garnettii]|uniref:Pyroglutamylated RFamide peptide n=1 Tax=Otolemur garnettii TaxID=30611 RepID=H0XPT9_OTOGA|nr:orexigenic neuropeptide QRFP [Otolemur garnettii]